MSRSSSTRWFTAAVAGVATALAFGLQAGVVPATVATALPAGPTDESKVPHYFGPWPNWANSPLTLSKAQVVINGTGTGAAAVAQVDPATGRIKSIDVTAPGHDYDATTTTVTVTGGTTDATATAAVSTSGVVVGFTNVVGGAGYTAFSVVLSGGGGSSATAIGSGGVDAVIISDGGSGYTMPTVDFDLPDSPNGTVAKGHVPMIANGDPVDGMDANGTVTQVIVDDPGSGYTTAPAVAIHNGTQFDPINFPAGGGPATVSATLELSAVNVDALGSGYTSAPSVAITDPSGAGTGASATALSDAGAITGITVDPANPGAGFLTQGMKKFVDKLPGTCTPPACPTDPTAKFIPTAVPAEKPYNGVKADEYVIGLVQYRTKFSSELPGSGTLVRGYVQLETPDNADVSQHVPLVNELMDGTSVPVTGGYMGVTRPQYLGPFIGATKDKPVRIVFRNLLPTGTAGDLFLPTDSTMMGSGMGPMGMAAPADQSSVMDGVRNPACTESPKSDMCFKDNRATLHLHGGVTPWISDGTPHQWITPAGESTAWPQGVSVQNVPDMKVDPADPASATTCEANNDGCSTFFYSNQQSARLMFYHDHSWGITRLNVYAGEAAGYAITDDTEKKLIADGVIPAAAETIPLIVQDKTFVPGAEQLYDTKSGTETTRYGQDPTWDAQRWGGPGSLWYHHVYMPAQNPGDPSGMSAYGRWMYGPWFWPPASNTTHGTIANPYYDPNCKLDVPSTWKYQTDPFCEPEQIPGTPNISAGMEQFNDTPVVNGVAYPKVTLEPKTYRLRLLNAANDRFFNFQWYTADTDPANGGALGTEVALKPAELAAAQTDPNVSPTPVGANNNAAGPDWVQIGTEGGFLPAPAVVDGQQPTTWITDPTRFDVGNVDKHSLLLAPAERADTIVDFSKFAGKTLILYNDAPAAFPARVPSYDYYTGGPDLSPTGAPTVLPGYGPNTRTVMQVTIGAATPAPAFNLTKLQAAFRHNTAGTGVFESGQNPVIVGQAAYNSAYGSSFAASSNCNAPNSTVTRCDGLVRVNDTTTFGFNTLKAPNAKMSMQLGPKALHDEMNSTTFDEFGRMQATMGIEAQPPSPGLQNVTLYPYINPATELIDGTNLPKADVKLDAGGLPAGDVKVTPISTAADGTQIWRFTHNGVDTHPIHFHLYDVQIVNRVTWDNIIIPTEPSELGWKDTVRMSPLEDTIVALRPIIPKVPFEVPNAVRPLNPMMPIGDQSGFNNIDPQGNPTGAIVNSLVNMGWEYVIHCHILSHEEMDMMRPVSVALPPVKVGTIAASVNGNGANRKVTLTWTDNSITETSYLIQRSTNGTTWTTSGTLPVTLAVNNTTGSTRTFTDPNSVGTTPYLYRVIAQNTVGYGGAYPSMTVGSTPTTVAVNGPAAPTTLTATLQAGPAVSLTWRDNASNETGFVVERSTNKGPFSQIATPAARGGTGNVTFVDNTVTVGNTYDYRVAAVNIAGVSAVSNTASISVDTPGTPAILTGSAARVGANERVTVTWADVSNESSYVVQWSANGFVTISGQSGSLSAGSTTFTTGNIPRQAYGFRVVAVNVLGTSTSASFPVPIAP
ncbi:multicopper oxidase domain-containing protein [Terrabacter sp. AAH1]